MKKIFVTILLFSLLLQVNAGRKFYKIGNYTKVEILKITAKGIQVLHSYGIGYITDENLSESEKKLLQPEIEQYHKLKNIRAANIEKITNSQTQELDDLIKRLPGMKYNELQAWSKKRVGVYIPHKKFEEKYSQTFYFAKNKSLFYKMLIKKVKTLQTEKLNNLMKNLPKMSWKEMQIWCKQNTGLYLSNKHFFVIFDAVFSQAENKDNCYKQLRSKAQKIYNESLNKFSKKLCKISPDEINIYCQKNFGTRYSYQKLKEELEERFYLASNIKNTVNRIDVHIRYQRMKKREKEDKEHHEREKEYANLSEFPVFVTIKCQIGMFNSTPWPYGCEYKLYADNCLVGTIRSSNKTVSFKTVVNKGATLSVKILAENEFGGIGTNLDSQAAEKVNRPNQHIVILYR